MKRLRESYDRAARSYGREWAPALARVAAHLVEALPLEPCRRVLDAGCGVGSLLAPLRAAAPRARVVGVDLSHGMLCSAPAGSPVVVGDLCRMPFADGSFDAVVSAFVLFHVPRPRDAFAEFARIVPAGGVLGTATWIGDPDFPAQRVWVEELLRAGPAPEAATADHSAVDTPAKVSRLFREAGFASPTVEERPLDFAFTPDSLIELRSYMGCSGRRVASLSPARRAAFLETVRTRLAALPADALVDRNRAILAWGRRG